MYQVLARKWRPKNFHELVGQTHVAQALTYALDHNRIHHAYLFTGTRGVGKTTIARIFAKSLNCQKNHISSNPCGECDHCLEIDQGRFPDLLEVDAASRTGVDDTRELLDNVPYAPVKGRFKVYLIDEVHMFSKSSFNALLKTLEEPPAHVKFILATTDPQKLPATILSRCLQFHLKNMSENQIAGHLSFILERENAAFEMDALRLLAHAAAGSMRDSLSLLDQALAYGQGKITVHDVASLLGAVSMPQLLNLLESMIRQDAKEMRKILMTLDEYSPDYSALLQSFLQCLQKISIVQLDAQCPEDDIPQKLQQIAVRMPVELTQLWYQIATDTWQNLPYQPDPRMALEMGLLRMLALQPVFPPTDLAKIRPIPEAKPIEDNASFAAIVADLQEGGESVTPKNRGTGDHESFSSQNQTTGNHGNLSSQNQTTGNHGSFSSQNQTTSNHGSFSPQNLTTGNHESFSSQNQSTGNDGNLSSQNLTTGSHESFSSQNPTTGNHGDFSSENLTTGNHGSFSSENQTTGSHESFSSQNQTTGNDGNLSSQNPTTGSHEGFSSQNLTTEDFPQKDLSNSYPPAPPVEEKSSFSENHGSFSSENLTTGNDGSFSSQNQSTGNHENLSDFSADVDPYADIPPWECLPDELPAAWDAEDAPVWQEESVCEKKSFPSTGKSLEQSASEWVKDIATWAAFLQILPLNNFPLMLLECCCPHDWQSPVLSLFFDRTGESFCNEQNILKAEEALTQFFGAPCKLQLSLREDVFTPLLFYQKQRDAAEKKMVEDFLSHPMVQMAQTIFGEQVQINNIQSTKQEQKRCYPEN